MEISKLTRSKLDYDLLTLLATPGLEGSARVSVVVKAQPDRLDSVVSQVRAADGQVRHVLTELDSVSAWITIATLRSLVENLEVLELEATQIDTVAFGK